MTTLSHLATLQTIENELNARAPGMKFVLALHILAGGSGDVLATYTSEVNPVPVSESIGEFKDLDGITAALQNSYQWMEDKLKKSDEIMEQLGISSAHSDAEPDIDEWELLKRQLFSRRS